MTGSMATWARLILVVTFVAAAFFVAPIADAATCAPEPPVAHTLAAHDPGEGDHRGMGSSHGICAHGHCHHNGTARSDADDSLLLHAHARPVHAFPSNDRPASVSPDGLKRPPRV
ncbi:hypothetical protein D3C77_362160 [compost metagenome]